jgi:hypothetical protein
LTDAARFPDRKKVRKGQGGVEVRLQRHSHTITITTLT